MRTIAWLNKKYRTLHLATGEPFAEDVRAELMPLCDQEAAQAEYDDLKALLLGNARHLNTENKRLLAALHELVALEDMRLRLRGLHEMGRGTDYENYHRRLPLAWDAARAALGPNAEVRRTQGPGGL